MSFAGRVPQRAIMEHDTALSTIEASSRGQAHVPAESTGGPQHPDDGVAGGTGQPSSLDGRRPVRGQVAVTRAKRCSLHPTLFLLSTTTEKNTRDGEPRKKTGVGTPCTRPTRATRCTAGEPQKDRSEHTMYKAHNSNTLQSACLPQTPTRRPRQTAAPSPHPTTSSDRIIIGGRRHRRRRLGPESAAASAATPGATTLRSATVAPPAH